MPARYLNIAAYLFVPLDDLVRRRRELKAACEAAGLRGTILLSREGINLVIAGEEDRLREFLQWLTAEPEFVQLEVKESWSSQQPFNRMLVRLKSEIISMGVDGIDPRTCTSPKVAPLDLKQWLDEGRELLLLDVRNDYEVSVGSFHGARAIGLDHFRNFPAAVEALPEEMKDQPVVMFCTGGIRCEKAGPYMQRLGFRNVLQLDGGILKYFEECGGAHYAGDCFVFDKRVALNPELRESGLRMCFVCQAILTAEDQASLQYVYETSCPHCFEASKPTLPTREARNRQISEAVLPLPGSIAYDNVRPIRIPARLEGTSLMECMEELFPHMGKKYWREEFHRGRVRLGDRVANAEMVARSGQRYAHWFPKTVEPDVSAEITVIYEDEWLLIASKPAPLPMHPSGRFNRNTLVWMLRDALCLPTLRPVHRLDANTTGVAIFAKTKAVAGRLQRLLDGGKVKKTYLAQCIGVPNEERFVCKAQISQVPTVAGGRECRIDPSRVDLLAPTLSNGALGEQEFVESTRRVGLDAERDVFCDAETRFLRLRSYEDRSSLLEAHPITGRTNQIRIHLWHLGHPIVGDPMYLADGKLGDTQTLEVGLSNAEPMRLHAWRAQFDHPLTGEEMSIEAATPSWVRVD